MLHNICKNNTCTIFKTLYNTRHVAYTHEVTQMNTWSAFVMINWFLTGDRIVSNNPVLYNEWYMFINKDEESQK